MASRSRSADILSASVRSPLKLAQESPLKASYARIADILSASARSPLRLAEEYPAKVCALRAG
jgi:hypothetical protein